MTTKKNISILLPAHNEAPRIYANLLQVCETVDSFLAGPWKDTIASFEVIAINDGSTDTTYDEICRAREKRAEIRCVSLEKNVGKGSALRYATRRLSGDYVFFIDADLDISPTHMSEFLRIMRDTEADAVLGSKRASTQTVRYPWYRRIVSITYGAFARILLPLPVRDTQTGFKLFSRTLIDNVFPCMLVRRYAFDIELLAIAHRRGFSLLQAPVAVSFSDKKGSVTIRNIYHMFFDTLAVFYRIRVLKYYDTWAPKHYDYTPRISIVIAVKNDNPYLRQSLAHIATQDYPDYEVIVLPDEPIDTLAPPVRVIPTGNELPARKRNIGVENATGEIIAFLDDDAYPIHNWLQELAANFSASDVGAVGGPGTTPPEDSFWQRVSGAVYASIATSGEFRYRYIYDRRRESIDDYPTCNLAVRKEVFLAAGGFQTNYWPGEDTELCLSITKKCGYRIVYDPMVEVHHHRRSLWNGHFKQVTQYALHRGFFVKKFPETSRRWQYFVPSLFTLGLATGWIFALWRTTLPLFFLYCAVLIVYVICVAAASFLAAPRLILPTMLGTLLTHCAYGIYFLIGLCAPRLSKKEEGEG